MFFGDECFGTKYEHLSDSNSALNSLRIYEPRNLAFMNRYFRSSFAKNIAHYIDSSRLELQDNSECFDNQFDHKHYFSVSLKFGTKK